MMWQNKAVYILKLEVYKIISNVACQLLNVAFCYIFTSLLSYSIHLNVDPNTWCLHELQNSFKCWPKCMRFDTSLVSCQCSSDQKVGIAPLLLPACDKRLQTEGCVRASDPARYNKNIYGKTETKPSWLLNGGSLCVSLIHVVLE